MTLPDPDESTPPAPASENPPPPERFPELAELEEEIRRRLRSNQRFLDKFLDEEYVDDEAGGDEEDGTTGEEEL